MRVLVNGSLETYRAEFGPQPVAAGLPCSTDVSTNWKNTGEKPYTKVNSMIRGTMLKKNITN
jgi:hypothetical protein